jgi:hypothetical protein
MSFDANSFLDSTIAGASSTERILIEPGVYPAFIADLKTATGFSEKSNSQWARLDVVFELDDETQKERTGRARILMTYGIMLDLDENGDLDMKRGRNVRLGKFRKAVGKNDGPLNPRELMHLYAKVEVRHEIYNNEPQEKIANVSAMA